MLKKSEWILGQRERERERESKKQLQQWEKEENVPTVEGGENASKVVRLTWWKFDTQVYLSLALHLYLVDVDGWVMNLESSHSLIDPLEWKENENWSNRCACKEWKGRKRKKRGKNNFCECQRMHFVFGEWYFFIYNPMLWNSEKEWQGGEGEGKRIKMARMSLSDRWWLCHSHEQSPKDALCSCPPE